MTDDTPPHSTDAAIQGGHVPRPAIEAQMAAVEAKAADTLWSGAPLLKGLTAYIRAMLAASPPHPIGHGVERAVREAIVLIDEINERKSSRDFYGIGQTLHNKLATIRLTLARLALTPTGSAEPEIPAGCTLLSSKADDDCGCPEEEWDTPWGYLFMHLNVSKPTDVCLDLGDPGQVEAALIADTVEEARTAAFRWASVAGVIVATPKPVARQSGTLEEVERLTIQLMRDAADKPGMKIGDWVSQRMKDAADQALGTDAAQAYQASVASQSGGDAPAIGEAERIALVLLNDDRTAAGLPAVASRDGIRDSEGYVRNARAVLAALSHPTTPAAEEAGEVGK